MKRRLAIGAAAGVLLCCLLGAGTARQWFAIPITVPNGGTGASAAAAARTNLGTNFYRLAHAGQSTLNPADSTTYYQYLTGLTTDVTYAKRFYCKRAGTLTSARFTANVFGALGTTESTTVSVFVNGAGETTVTSSLQMNAKASTVEATGLSVAVSAGDYITVKLAMPAFATNPTAVCLETELEITY